MRATGFHVLQVADGCYDVDGIVSALHQARANSTATATDRRKPTFINIKTTIGLGSAVAGQAQAHGAPFGADDVQRMKTAHGFDPTLHLVSPPPPVRAFFADLPARGEAHVAAWTRLVDRYAQAYPELSREFHARMRGEGDLHLRERVSSLVPSSFPTEPTASRVAGGWVLNPLAREINSFMVGTADLSPSVNLIWEGKEDFQSVCFPSSLSNTLDPVKRLTQPPHP